MSLRIANPCPSCGLVLLHGAIFDAMREEEQYGPILGLHREANRETARAGYVGISSLWLADRPEGRALYRCPRCAADPLIEVTYRE